jgi:hypothetical protein
MGKRASGAGDLKPRRSNASNVGSRLCAQVYTRGPGKTPFPDPPFHGGRRGDLVTYRLDQTYAVQMRTAWELHEKTSGAL